MFIYQCGKGGTVRDLLQVFKALSDQTRLRILSLLSRRELCVCELAEALGMEQSRVSHQLHVLKNARLVDDRREGRWIVYSLDSEDGRSYNPQIFELVSVVLARDETVRDDGRRRQGGAVGARIAQVRGRPCRGRSRGC